MTRAELVERVRRAKPRLLPARFRSRCRVCGEAIEPGEMIAWSSLPSARFTLHDGCHADAWLEGEHDGKGAA
ncbi:MAG: hypothetical protein RIF41_11260 [Polyangiaceae bacterium]